MTTTPTYSSTGYLGPNPSVARLYDNVQAMIPDVPLEVVKMMAWNTIEDFYLNTGYKRDTVYWELAPGATQIDFNTYGNGLKVAWIGEFSGLTNYKVVPPALVIDLSVSPQATRTGQALLFLKPTAMPTEDGCSCIGEELWSNWFECILNGTLARLFAMPMKPYSSPALSSAYFTAYSSQMGRARAVAQAGYNQQARWRFPYFAGGRRKN
jgi:hypothetical protein